MCVCIYVEDKNKITDYYNVWINPWMITATAVAITTMTTKESDEK